MYKYLITALAFLVTLGVNANEYRQVCANHILVPTEMDAIKLKSQIKSYEDFKYYARIYSTCPSGRNGGSLGCFGRGQMAELLYNQARSIHKRGKKSIS